MADNYLERRMDDYRSGRLGNKTPTSRQRQIKDRTYLLVGEPTELCGRIIETLRVAGTVVWIGNSEGAFRRYAQRYGARLYPQGSGALQRAVDDYGTFDAAVITGDIDSVREVTSVAKQTVVVITDGEGEKTFETAESSKNSVVLGVRNNGDDKAVAEICRLFTSRDARHLNGILVTIAKN